MAVNLSNLPSLDALGFSLGGIGGALNQAGTAAIIHATLGTLLTIVSLIGTVMAVRSKVTSVRIFGILGFLSTALAALNGVLFTLSGFQNDGYSHGMATGFILTFGFYFLELYFLKPTRPRSDTAAAGSKIVPTH